VSVLLALLRHASTDWNEAGRLQGQTDTDLSSAGAAAARTWRLPEPADRWKRMTSPLRRARRTAELLQPSRPATVDSRLREMSFGVWEGQTLADLRRRVGKAFLDAERRGLDFLPPGGESPRMVMARLALWAAEVQNDGQPVVAVSHKAAIRAALALATGWDMTDRAPIRLEWRALHYFAVESDGRLRLERANVPLQVAS